MKCIECKTELKFTIDEHADNINVCSVCKKCGAIFNKSIFEKELKKMKIWSYKNEEAFKEYDKIKQSAWKTYKELTEGCKDENKKIFRNTYCKFPKDY